MLLIAPDGTEIILSNQNGDNGQGYTNTVFDDDAPSSITTGTAPFTGSFIPEESLSTLNGSFSAGDWTLSIEDTGNLDAGEFLDWNLQLCEFSNDLNNDVGITAITSPNTGERLGDAELVTITLQSFGGEEQSNFDVSYIVNGGTPVIENFPGPIAAGERISYTFATPVDLSVAGLYEIIATSSLSNDTDNSNDSITISIENQACQTLSNTMVQSIG